MFSEWWWSSMPEANKEDGFEIKNSLRFRGVRTCTGAFLAPAIHSHFPFGRRSQPVMLTLLICLVLGTTALAC